MRLYRRLIWCMRRMAENSLFCTNLLRCLSPPMDKFFDTLAQTNSSEKAMAELRKVLLRRRLDIVDDGRTYEEALAQFKTVKKLLLQESVLRKIFAELKKKKADEAAPY